MKTIFPVFRAAGMALFFLSISLSTGVAQLLRYGIKGSTNLTVVIKGGSFYESVKPAPGHQFGVYVKLRPAKPLRFQAEALFTQNE